MTPPRQLPNLITAGRLVLAVALFVSLELIARSRGAVDPGEWLQRVASNERLLWNVSLAIFFTAAVSDVLDGKIARRWGLTTDFGRILDPFADKVIVCGAFVQLIPLVEAQVAPWMVVVILARELLVDGLRGFAESRGVAFPAMRTGKAKMFTQSSCLTWIFAMGGNLSGFGWAATVTRVWLWVTLGATVASGVHYVVHARRVLTSDSTSELGGAKRRDPADDAPTGAPSVGSGRAST